MKVLIERPTRVRYGVLAFACVLSMITYLDRVCMGTVAPYLQTEFRLDDSQMGLLFAAFTLSYAMFEVPTGWLGDVFGPRVTLIRIVLWWSFFTVLTGLVYPIEGWLTGMFWLLLVARFLFGLGEAGAYPNIAKAFHNWFPFQERGSAKGAVWMSGRFAGGITAIIVLAMVYETQVDGATVVHWRHTFWIFGGIGVVWCVLFYAWFRDRPEQHPGVNAAEVAYIRGDDTSHAAGRVRVPWTKLMGSGNLWALCLMYACAAYGWYFNITFLPKYMFDQFGIEKGDKWSSQWWGTTIMFGLPLLCGAAACLFGGLLTDAFIKRTGNRKWGRRLFGVLGHSLCALCYFVAIAVHAGYLEIGVNPAWLFVGAIAMAAFFNDMTMGAAWASCIDIGGKFSGIVSGCMNTVGNFGGFLANIITGLVLSAYTAGIDRGADPDAYNAAMQPAWSINFAIFGAVYVVAVGLWMLFDSSQPVAPEAHQGAPPHAESPASLSPAGSDV